MKLKKSLFLLSSLMMLTVGAGIVNNEVKAVEAASYSLKIEPSDFNGNSYADNNGEHEFDSTEGVDYTLVTNQTMLQSSAIQMQKSKGYIYNKDELSGFISSIEIDVTAAACTIYSSNKLMTSAPSSSTGSTSNNKYTPNGDHKYFYIKASTSAATKLKSITINYTVDSGETPDPEVPVTTYTATFVVENGTCDTTSMETEGSVIMPNVTANDGYEFAGWSDGKNTYKAGDTVTINQDTTFTAVINKIESEDPEVPGDDINDGTWTLVKSTADLDINDKVIIVASDYNYALSNVQNTNNRGQAAVNKSDDTLTFNSNVQELTLQEGTTSGTFAFYTGNGYLYAASSDKNYLKTQQTNNANGSWKITIDNSGVATIKAQGSNTRNWLRYNATNSSGAMFSCYGSGQMNVSLYEYITSNIPVETKYKTTFDANGGTFADDSKLYETYTLENESVVFPEDPSYDGYEFAGWYYGEVKYTEMIATMSAPETLTAKWIKTSESAKEYYSLTKVENIESLNIGDIIVIGATAEDDKTYVMGADRGTNRFAVEHDLTTNFVELNLATITLEAGSTEDTFALKTSDGYLCAPSVTNNELKTRDDIDFEGQTSDWEINFEEGVTFVIAKTKGVDDKQPRSDMRYNPNKTGGTPIFSCYGVGNNMTNVEIYKVSSSKINYQYDDDNTPTAIRLINTITTSNAGDIESISLSFTKENVPAGPIEVESLYTSVANTFAEAENTYYVVYVLNGVQSVLNQELVVTMTVTFKDGSTLVATRSIILGK